MPRLKNSKQMNRPNGGSGGKRANSGRKSKPDVKQRKLNFFPNAAQVDSKDIETEDSLQDIFSSEDETIKNQNDPIVDQNLETETIAIQKDLILDQSYQGEQVLTAKNSRKSASKWVDEEETSESETESDSYEDDEDDENFGSNANPVEDYLLKVKETLKTEIKRNGKPDCYSKSTFWVRAPEPCFSNVVSPKLFYYPDVFVWLPRLLCTIKCTGCHSNELETKEWCKRRVANLNHYYWLFFRRLYCRSCKITFNTHTSEVLEQLPDHLKETFPAEMTHKSALDKPLVQLIRVLFYEGVGPEPTRDLIKEFQYREYHQRLLKYLSLYNSGKSVFSTAQFEPFSSFKHKFGYQGRIPSTSYLKDIYVSEIEKRRRYYDADVIKRAGKILSCDHSFTIAKHLGKLRSFEVFNCLFTVLNEYGEIRGQVLAFNKGHEQLLDPLTQLKSSMTQLRHPKVELFYSDNAAADKNLLEKAFPELKLDLFNKKESNLPLLTIPDDIAIDVLLNEEQINDACAEILKLSQEVDELIVGFDTEWEFNVYLKKKYKTSLVQIAYEGRIVLLKLKENQKQLPQNLARVISSEKIKKVGRQIAGDLKKLHKDYGADYSNFLELGSFCKAKGIIKDGRSSLSFLVECVLRKKMNKEASVRLSSWSSELSQEQIKYAALDAYASLKIYEKANAIIETNERLTEETARVGLHVKIWKLGAAIAIGKTVAQPDNWSGNRKQTSKKVICEVSEILAGSNVPLIDSKYLLCHVSNLSLLANPTVALSEDQPIESIPGSPLISPEVEVHLDESTVYSRVLQDPFHFMAKIETPVGHGWKTQFERAFSDAIFIMDEEDVHNVECVLMGKGQSFAEVYEQNPDYILKRVKRHIPNPAKLYLNLKKVFEFYQDKMDAETQKPLFNSQARIEATKCLELVKKGFLSDPPGVILYYEQKLDHDGLNTYRCSRGTNAIEGGVHNKLKRKFAPYNASFQFADCLLAEFRHRHNNRIARINRGGSYSFEGHFDVWIVDRIQILSYKANEGDSTLWLFKDWVNTFHFNNLKEQFGIVRNISSMYLPYEKSIPMKKAFHFLACKLDTRYPILPVHTIEEMDLFHNLMKGSEKPKLNDALVDWNSRADGINIYYKNLIHLEAYMKIYLKKQNVSNSLNSSRIENLDLRRYLMNLATDLQPANVPERILMPPVQTVPVVRKQVLKPMLPATSVVPMQKLIFESTKKRHCSICGSSDCRGRGKRSLCPQFNGGSDV